jgi:transposase
MAVPAASTLLIDDAIRKPLTALARSQKAPHRLVVRARIVLAAADGLPNAVIARMLSLSEDTVRTWRGRFIDGGIAGLADRRRTGRPLRYGPEVHLRIVATVTGERPEAGSVWTHRLIAEHLADVGISASQIGRILADLDLKPHRVRGRVARREFEYIRHGTVPVIAALDVHSGQVITEAISRNNSATFISFLAMLDQHLDPGADHSPRPGQRLLAHLESHQEMAGCPSALSGLLHTPKHASWLDQAELFFSILTRRLLRRGEFTSRQDLADKIENFTVVYNRTAKPYRWTYDGRPLKVT